MKKTFEIISKFLFDDPDSKHAIDDADDDDCEFNWMLLLLVLLVILKETKFFCTFNVPCNLLLF